MRKLVVLGALLLGGCVPSAEQQWHEKMVQEQADDSKCRSYGAKPGEAAYVQCRAQLDAARTQADATAATSHTVIVQDSAPAPTGPLILTHPH